VFLKEEARQLTPEEALDRKTEFRPLPIGSRINFGLGQAPIWLRFEVENASPAGGEWILGLGRSYLTELQISVLRNENVEILLDGSSGSGLKPALRRYGKLAVSLPIDRGEEITVLVRYQGPNSSGLYPRLTLPDDYFANRTIDMLIYVAATAAIITLTVYNLALFFATWRIVYVYYILSQLSLLVYYSHLAGYTTAYAFTEHLWLIRDWAEIFGLVATALLLQFARAFFDVRSRAPRLDRALRALLWLMALALPFCVLENDWPVWARQSFYLVNTALPALAWAAVIGISWYGTWKWDRSGWPFALAWLITMMLLAFTVSSIFGLVPVSRLQTQLITIVSVLEAFGMSMGLALQVRALHRRSRQTEQLLRDSLRSELAQARAAARHAEEKALATKDLVERIQLIRSASHDARQVLLSLRLFARRLSGAQDIGSINSTGQAIELASEQLADVLSTTLTASASGGGYDGTVALSTLEPDAILQGLRLIHEPEAAIKRLDLRIRCNAGTFVGDRALILRVLGNLLENAIRYTERGAILLTARKNGNGIRFQVFDTGPGMSEEQAGYQMSVLRPNRRLAGTDSEGEGSGLKTAQRLVARLGGTISLCTRQGRGSRFDVNLPQPETAETPVDAALFDIDAPGFVEQNLNRTIASGQRTIIETHDENLRLHDEYNADNVTILVKPVSPEARALANRISGSRRHE
jgi:signal transduction histidine kinase